MKRSRVSERQRLIVQEVGIALLIILAIYVTRNDVNRWFLR